MKKKTPDDYSHFQNQTLGWLTIKEMGKLPVTKYRKVLCVCRCGNTIETPLGYILRGSIRTCGCGNSTIRSGNSHCRWSGYEEIGGTYWKNLKHGAELRGIPFLITKEEIWELFLQQDRRCALTGMLLTFPKTRRVQDVYDANASLDRIDASKPYVKENLQWVDKKINMMKQRMNNDTFVEYCEMVVNYRKGLIK